MLRSILYTLIILVLNNSLFASPSETLGRSDLNLAKEEGHLSSSIGLRNRILFRAITIDMARVHPCFQRITDPMWGDEELSLIKEERTLSLSSMGITSLLHFPESPALVELDLSNNNLASLQGLSDFEGQLSTFNLANNRLKSLEYFSDASMLSRVFLGANELESLSGIPEELPNISVLDLAENNLVDLSAFTELGPKIKEINLSFNPNLKDIDPLIKVLLESKFYQKVILRLEECPEISDHDIEALNAIGHLTVLVGR